MPLTYEELKQIEKSAKPLAKAIAKAAAQHQGNEAGFRRQFANLIDDIAEHHGITLALREEYTVATGRADAVYNRFVIEYEPPGSLRPSKTHGHTKHAIKQVHDYIEGVSQEERQLAHRLAGVATDGCYYIFVRHVDQQEVVEDPVEVNEHSTAYLLRLLFSLTSGRALIPKNLIDDFGSGNLVAQQCARALYHSLEGNPPQLVGKIFEQWQTFFGEVTGYEEGSARLRDKKELQAFAKGMGLDPKKTDPPKLFFAIHTYFAILIKFIAWLALSRFVSAFGTNFASLQNLPGEELQRQLKEMERGGIFRRLGIRNFLEGDFFGWYLTTWNQQVEDSVRVVLQRLADYDPATLEVSPEQARDLLKKLYHGLMPRELRHDLGEYYTPDWLAQRLLNQLGGGRFRGDPRKRLIDPACGSGTFLVLAIGAMKRRCQELGYSDQAALELILKNIVGIDLNPLAVVAARTNYLLALGDLLESRTDEVDIPVYLADSILMPARGRDLFGSDRYSIRTAVGPFDVPGCIDTQGEIETLANLLDECVESETSAGAFLKRARTALATTVSDGEWRQQEDIFRALYQRLLDLHNEGLNGIWARIVKNAFMPLYLGEFDYVAGNPPWVNWRNLPDEYREEIAPLWGEYGLFPHTGLRARLGSAMDDISILMLYVSMDHYLKRNGALGFVITQSVFKSEGGGRGFRRLQIGKGARLKVICVDDMLELRPFEGVQNRTSVVIMRKGRPTTFPVPWTFWRKGARGTSLPSDIALDDALARTRRANWVAMPVRASDPTSPWLTGRRQAIRNLGKCMGESDYRGRKGATPNANAVYWLDVRTRRPDGLLIVSNITDGAKRKVESVQSEMEADFVFPLLRGRDVRRWSATPSAYIVLAQDPGNPSVAISEKRLSETHPKTYGYLKRFESALRGRQSSIDRELMASQAFYAAYGVGPYTLSPFKLVWKEIAGGLICAVSGPVEDEWLGEKTVVPDHKLILVAADTKQEAHYLCAALNSSPAQFLVWSYAVTTQVGTHVLNYVHIPPFRPRDPVHRKLSELSMAAHAAAGQGLETKLAEIERGIDTYAAKLWDLSAAELASLQQSLADVQGGDSPLPSGESEGDE
ncbi:MAG TPA: N-6 DNA methylase [Anaerolineae bacterium]|nr:N-6 DNA methylase [Anaerolineae bacterium]